MVIFDNPKFGKGINFTVYYCSFYSKYYDSQFYKHCEYRINKSNSGGRQTIYDNRYQ